MTTISITLYPVMVRGKQSVTPPSKNNRFHHFEEAAIVKAWREQAHALCLVHPNRPRCSLVRIALTRFFCGVEPDEDNLMTQSKPIIDGIVASGIAPDDSRKHVERMVCAIRTRTRRDQRWKADITPMRLAILTTSEVDDRKTKRRHSNCPRCNAVVASTHRIGLYLFAVPCGHPLPAQR